MPLGTFHPSRYRFPSVSVRSSRIPYLVLRYKDYQKVITITDENRELLAYGGWPG